MGVIAVRRDQIEEWVLPAPRVTVGDALFTLETVLPALVAGVASAGVVPAGPGSVTVTVSGDAEVEGAGDVFAFPAPLGEAVVAVEAPGLSDLARPTAGIAFLDVQDSVSVEVAADAVAGVVVVGVGDFVVPQVGDAEVEFEYYGDGDTPIFPFNLPFLFLPIDFSNLIAEAEADIVGLMDCEIEVDGRSQLVFSGSSQLIFDGAPGLITSECLAVVGIEDGEDSSVACFGVADVYLDGISPTLNPAFFPATFPFVLQEIIGGAEIVLSSISDTEVYVDGLADIDVYTVFSVD